jgi:glycosyltransferase involved in cell wall biosynthesis
VKVALFGAFDPEYPRTAVVEEALAGRGVEVVRIAVPPRTPAFVREVRLAARWAARARGLRALLVPAFGHRDVALASLLGRQSGVPVLFDPLVSRWDTQVMDLGRVKRGSPAESRLRLSDRTALRLADLVLCDTWEQGDFYSTRYGVPRRRLARIPVGADGATFRAGAARTPRPAAGPTEILYVGGYLPLHGMEAILEAATILEDHHGTRLARFTLIGNGMMRPYVEREVAARGLACVRLLPRIPYAEAVRRMAEADIALGVFGTSEKAGRVVPHKVWQAMAMGLPVVTRRSGAISEYFRDGSHLRCVPAGDGASLARVLEELAGDPDARARLGAAGREAALREGSPERIGALLLEAVERALELTAPRPGGRRT